MKNVLKCAIALLILLSAGPQAFSAAFSLKSPVFNDAGAIPAQYTCDGRNINPALTIANIPAETKSLVLIVDDPDAPMGIWVHWVVYNIPPITSIEEGSIPGVEGFNDFSQLHYGGPCPPGGTHRYFFKLYALDAHLQLQQGATKNQVEQAMQGHILAEAQLMGKYGR